jgi:thiol-disulfide isomerase/thioredoxin
VLFYASWNRKSTVLLHELEIAAEHFADPTDTSESMPQFSGAAHPRPPVQFGVVHGPHYKAFSKAIGVKSFPELRVYVRGHRNYHVYTGHDFTHVEITAFLENIRATDHRKASSFNRDLLKKSGPDAPLLNPRPGMVHDLTLEEFHRYRNSTGLLLFVMFYAPWCSSCKASDPTMQTVAEYFRADNSVMIARLDCDIYRLFCVETMNIDGYPTWYTFHKPSVAKEGERYSRGRHFTDIQAYLDNANRFRHIEGLAEMKEKIDKYKGMSQDQLPTDISELGGIFSEIGSHMKEKPEKIRDRQKRRKRNGQ